MKFIFLFFSISLMGCFHKTWVDTIQPMQVSEGPIARGFDPPISWSCQQTEVNSSLVWIECNFHNDRMISLINQRIETCIQVSYYNEESHYMVVSSRILCSGYLGDGEEHKNYVAFINKDREQLTNQCGVNLKGCVMLAGKN